MKMNANKLLVGFLVWRAKHINTKYFVLILSVIIGAVTSFAAFLLKNAVILIRDAVFYANDQLHSNLLLLIAPLAGVLLTYLFVRYLNRNLLGRGIPSILYCLSRKAGFVEPDKMYSHLVSSSLTVGFGGSVGLEAPIVTTGSAIGSNLGRLFHLNYKRRLLLVGCGAAGAIASLFNAPVAGVVFALEILLLELSIPSFLPILLASITGTMVSRLLNSAEIIIHYKFDYVFVFQELPLFILLGIVTGIVSIYFTRITYLIESIFLKIPNRFPRALVAGTILGVIIFSFPALYGEGYDVIRLLLSGNFEMLFTTSTFPSLGSSLWMVILFVLALVLFKVLATSLTIAGGGNGGVFAPSLVVGGLTGFIFARVFNMSGLPFTVLESSFALVAMAGLMTGVMHAPLTGIFLIAEITSGYSLIVPLMIVCTISYLTVLFFEPHSIFTKQLALKGLLVSHDKDKEVLSQMKLQRVIEKDLLTVLPDAKLGELVSVVKKSRRNIFPVVDEDRELKGIILLDDIREIMFKQDLYDKVEVKSLMHAPPAYVYLEDDMSQVMNKFKSTGAWNLPVLDGNTYIGFMSKSKIFNIYRSMLINYSKDE